MGIMNDKKCEHNYLSLSQLKKGDLLLYRAVECPQFVEPIFKNIGDNFGVLIDKLIIFASDPDKNPDLFYTHAALLYDNSESTGGTVAEATMPRCRLRNPVTNESFSVTVRRVGNNKDGSQVLKFLPDLSDNKQSDSYAILQAVMAGVAILLRMRIAKDNALLNAALAFLKVFLYPLGKMLDSYIEKFQKTDRAWFCSQLASYCYDMTAKETGDSDFLLKTPASLDITDSILEYLIKSNGNLSASKIDLCKYEGLSLESEDVIASGISFVNMLEHKDSDSVFENLSATDHKDIAAIALDFIVKVSEFSGIEFDKDNIEQSLINFQTAFIMPVDLINCLEEAGEFYVK